MTPDINKTFRFLQLETSRLQQENRDLREENETLREVIDALIVLQDISSTVTAETSVIGLLDRILESALKAINASSGSLILQDDDTKELVFAVVHGTMRDQLTNYRMPAGSGIAGWVAQNLEPVIISNAHLDPRFSSAVDETFNFETRSMLCVPIATSKRILGVLMALNKNDGKDFTPTDLALLAVVAQLASTAMERAEQAIPELA